MSDSDNKPGQKKGDEVLRKMLKTPPKPHEKKGDDRSRRPKKSHQDRNDGSESE